MNETKWFKLFHQDAAYSTEEKLACREGRPPWEVSDIPAEMCLEEFLSLLGERNAGLIFDGNFWMTRSCWLRWKDFLQIYYDTEKINIPLGNQNVEWREGMDIEPYMTRKGFEHSAQKLKENLFSTEAVLSHGRELCVAVVSRPLLEKLPLQTKIIDIKDHWLNNGEKLSIFSGCWLHSFGALDSEGERADLLDMTDWHGYVLELGCNKGLMAEACAKRGHRVTWIGIDLNLNSIMASRGKLAMSVQSDAGNGLPLSGRVKFDRIVCADFLEHLPYPGNVLKELREHISEQGELVISVPNVGHWLIVRDLLSGRWDETPSGTMCVTHLRFGTGATWKRWLNEAGWNIKRIESDKVCLPAQWKTAVQQVINDPDYGSLESINFKIVACSA